MMLHKTLVFLFLLITASPTFGGEKYALLVGVNEYDKRGISTLNYAERDVTVLGDELKKLGFNVKLMLGSKEKSSPLRSTKANIEKQIDSFLLNGKAGRDKNDIVLIAFCGHGMQKELIVPKKGADGKIFYEFAKDKNGQPIQDAYFLPVDARKDEVTTLVSLTHTLEVMGEKGGINLMLVDACRDDPTRSTRSITGNELNGKLPANTGVLFSCAAGQQAFEARDIGGGHGVFMYHVIEGLKGEAVDPKGNINWTFLDFYVRSSVNNKVLELFPERSKESKMLQTPHGFNNFTGLPPVLAKIKKIPPRNIIMPPKEVTKPTQKQPTQKQPTQKQPTQKQPTQKQPTQKQPTQKQPTQNRPSQKQSSSTEQNPLFQKMASNQNNVGEYSTPKTLNSTKQTFRLSSTLTGHEGLVEIVAFSPDGKTLASGGGKYATNGTIKLWDTSSGKLKQNLTGHKYTVLSVAFSPDGKTLASGSLDDTIKLWDASSGKLKQSLTGHESDVNSVAFSPDGKTLASGSGKYKNNGTIKLWDVSSGKLIQTLIGHQTGVYSVAFSPDGKTLASGNDYKIKIWDASSGKLTQTLTGHKGSVYSVAFSPDGKTLASGSTDKTIKLWDASSGKLKQTLAEHDPYVLGVAFSPDGKTLASGGGNKTIKLWDASSGKHKQTLTGHKSAVESVAFSPDGKTLASGSWDHTIKLWVSE